MIQPKDELIRDTKISGIKKQMEECINAVFSKGYETSFEQKKEIEDRAYQKGLEDGKQVGYDKGYEDGARCQDEVQYQQGFEDAWDMLKNICSGGRERMLKVFGTISITQIITDNTASEAKSKIDAWGQKEQNADIKVGDEVTDKDGDTYIVTQVHRKDVNCCDTSCMRADGHGYGIPSKNLTKTGRHYPEIAEVLKQMQE